MRIILASQSPRRRELLAKLTPEFAVVPSDADETLPQGILPTDAVRMLAHKKAAEIASRDEYSGDCVIGADTIVTIDGEILGKPIDRADAVAMLHRLSDCTHTVCTGMAVLTPNKPPMLTVTETAVTFYPLGDEEIARYVDSGEADDKAGSYGMQDGAYFMVKALAGDYFNVVGLPIATLYRQLQSLCLL